MKHSYIKPRATFIQLAVEGMIAESLTYDTTAEQKNEMLSSEKAWSSDNWTDADSED